MSLAEAMLAVQLFDSGLWSDLTDMERNTLNHARRVIAKAVKRIHRR